jgi:hypothetical protein
MIPLKACMSASYPAPSFRGPVRPKAEAETLHRARPEILDEHVRALHQIAEDVGTLRGLEIERQIALVAIDDQIRRRLPVLVRRPGT